MKLRVLHDDESGAVLVTVTLIMVALLLIAGLVIDLGAVRAQRADHQSVSDAAATAGAIAAAHTGSGQDACEAAKQYVVANSERISSLSGIDCNVFASTCTDLDLATTGSATEAGITVTLTYPVPDDSPLMDPHTLGAPAQPASSEDGTQCERFGVAVSSDYNTAFAGLAGVDTLAANVSTVAKSFLPEAESIPINLLVLDRSTCEAIEVGGSGSAGVTVGAIYNPDADPDTPGNQPALLAGLAAADSDASAGCSSGNGVIDIDGSNGAIRADGPAGCATQTGVTTVNGLAAGQGCGLIRVVAPGTPGCNPPACTSANPSYPNPPPVALPRLLTRAPVDYRYNCWSDYEIPPPTTTWATEPLTSSNEQQIPACDGLGTPHIYNLINDVGSFGPPSSLANRWTDSYSCTLASSTPPITLTGDWWIDCAKLSVNSTLTIDDADVVFDGDVDIRASGLLAIHNPPSDPGVALLRDGELKKAGQGTLSLINTTVYASKTSSINMAGGSGALTWIAPNTGPFDDLALWSDSASTHKWSGQANLNMQGVFFTPFATAEYSGGAGQNQVNAQFIADKLHATGNGALNVSPSFGRAVEFPVEPQSIIIR